MKIGKNVIIQKGDLAHHKLGVDTDSADVVEAAGLILKINPVLGSGFQSADIMWCKNGRIETVMLNYLKCVQKK